MDYNSPIRAITEVNRAITHLSSETFLALPDEDRDAHAAAYRKILPSLEERIPRNPKLLVSFNLLKMIVQTYE